MSATSTSKTRFVASTFAENPLPTADFSPPASCSGIYLTNGLFAIDNDPACLPNKFNGASTAFYSPGTACPTGYTAQPQCSRNGGVRSVTTVTCCPYRADVTLSCVENDLTLAGIWETEFCTWMAGPATVVAYTVTNDGTAQTSAATLSDRQGVNAWGIRMVYQASDLVAETTSGVETTSGDATATGAAATDTGSGGGGGGGGGDGGGGDGGDGLSKGGIVAVAVVVPIVVIAALAGLFLWWRRRKHRYAGVKQPTTGDADGQSSGQQSSYAYQNSSYAPSEMAGGSVAGYYQNDKVLMNPGQQGGHTHFEGYPHPAPQPAPAELPVGQGPAELPAEGQAGR